jgi:hypothetical protein
VLFHQHQIILPLLSLPGSVSTGIHKELERRESRDTWAFGFASKRSVDHQFTTCPERQRSVVVRCIFAHDWCHTTRRTDASEVAMPPVHLSLVLQRSISLETRGCGRRLSSTQSRTAATVAPLALFGTAYAQLLSKSELIPPNSPDPSRDEKP